jgi:imidazolonepropionase-like amidohydrolase
MFSFQTLKIATSSPARTLGLFSSIGSLSKGKLADYVVYPPNVNILLGDLSPKTRNPALVARGGRIWNASTMEEVWPLKGRKQILPAFNAD